MKVATCRIPEVTSPCQTLGAASLTCVAARQFVCHKHVCKGPFLASPKSRFLAVLLELLASGRSPHPVLNRRTDLPLEDSSVRWEKEQRARDAKRDYQPTILLRRNLCA